VSLRTKLSLVDLLRNRDRVSHVVDRRLEVALEVVPKRSGDERDLNPQTGVADLGRKAGGVGQASAALRSAALALVDVPDQERRLALEVAPAER
jgi:hypothetical protein